MKKYLYSILIAVLSISTTCLAAWTPYTESNSPLATDSVSSLSISSDNQILLGAHGMGLQVINNDIWRFFSEDSAGVPINYANSIAFSNDTLFIGSASGDLDALPMGEGLSIMHSADSTWEQLNHGLETNPIITDIISASGFRAVSTYGGGITIFNSEGWIRYQRDFRTEFSYADSQQQTFNVEPGTYLNSNFIFDLEYDLSQNVLWIASLEGAIAHTNDTWEIYDINNSGLPDNRIQVIKVDQSNYSVYFGTFGFGLVCKDGNEWTLYNTDNSPLVSNLIYSLEIRPDNNDLWIGTNIGLNAVTADNSWISYIPPDSNLVSGNFYSDIAFDSSGNVWVSAFGGGIASMNLAEEPEPEDTLFVDVKQLKFFIRAAKRNNLARISAFIEPTVDMNADDSVSITVYSQSGGIYAWNNLFSEFTDTISRGNRTIYIAENYSFKVALKYFHNRNRIKLNLLDWNADINQDNILPELNVRIKLGSFVGYDTVLVGVGDPLYDPDTDTLDYEPSDIFYSNNYYPAVTGIDGEDNNTVSDEYMIPMNYPNPFNASTNIQFYLAQPSIVTLTVYDITGRAVTTDKKSFTSGTHKFNWNGKTQASGIYFYSLQTTNNTYTGKMTLLK